MKILIVDDHAVVRRGVRQILDEEFPGAQITEATNGAEALELARKDQWTCIVLDISMPGRSGLDALRELKVSSPKVPVLVLSGHPEDQYALRVLKLGAAGYLTKDQAPEELVKALKRVLAGGKYITAALAEKLADQLQGETTRAPHELLSDREFEVLRGIATGRALKEIAAELSISEKTVSTYHTRLLEKMRLRSDAEVVRYALEHGLLN